MGPTQPPIHWIPAALSLGHGHEADHLHLSIAIVKNVWSYTSTPQYAFMAWCSVESESTWTTLPYLLPLSLPSHYSVNASIICHYHWQHPKIHG
jgi:hypothetical protein